MNDLERLSRVYSGVLSGFGGLIWHGLSNFFQTQLILCTTCEERMYMLLHGCGFALYPTIDTINFITPCKNNPNLLIPSEERSLVQHQQYETVVEDDEQLMLSLEKYLYSHKNDVSELLAVAKFYGREDHIRKSIELSKTFDSEY